MNTVITNLENEIKKLQNQIEANKELLKSEPDGDMQSLIQEEIISLESEILNYENSIKAINGDFDSGEVEGADTNINPNIAMLEIRGGTGGDEAGLFALDLFTMYTRFAEKKGWKVEEIFYSENEAGGIKTVSLRISGKGVYRLLRNESGVHRVQRVPRTEAAGRIHTSTATVAVLPELRKTNIEIRPEDLKIDFFRAGGKGGQNVNKVSTAVRITHLPTGLVVECQEERQQLKNREKALSILESRLYTLMHEQKVAKIEDLRSNQVGSGERSEKIRTYNYPQDRITDHRLGKNWHNMESVMLGNIETILEDTSKLDENAEVVEGAETDTTE